jgi:hypothetical protein
MAKRNLIKDLQAELAETEERAAALRSALAALGEVSFTGPRRGRRGRRPGAATGPKRGRRKFTAAQRKVQGDKMRAYWRKKKAAQNK